MRLEGLPFVKLGCWLQVWLAALGLLMGRKRDRVVDLNQADNGGSK
jgi:hypothetical protein